MIFCKLLHTQTNKADRQLCSCFVCLMSVMTPWARDMFPLITTQRKQASCNPIIFPKKNPLINFISLTEQCILSLFLIKLVSINFYLMNDQANNSSHIHYTSECISHAPSQSMLITTDRCEPQPGFFIAFCIIFSPGTMVAT